MDFPIDPIEKRQLRDEFCKLRKIPFVSKDDAMDYAFYLEEKINSIRLGKSK